MQSRTYSLLTFTLAGLAALLLWDAAGLDLPAARLFGGASGFALRGNPWLFYGLHEGPRFLAWALLAGLFATIRWPVGVLRRIPAGERARLAFTVLAAVLAVSLLKNASSSSCPWDLRDFGGAAPYVSHWAWGVVDGGGGRCFPAGHASAAFAWLAGGLVLRQRAPRAALRWFGAALALGLVLGLAQQARGAHFMSHTLWSACICWSVALVSEALAAAWRAWRIRPIPLVKDAHGNA